MGVFGMWLVRKSEFEELKTEVEKLKKELKKKADMDAIVTELLQLRNEMSKLNSRIAKVEIALRDSNVQQMREEYELFIRQMKQLNLKFLSDAVEEVKQKLDELVPELTTMQDYGRFKVEVEDRLTKIEDKLRTIEELLSKENS